MARTMTSTEMRAELERIADGLKPHFPDCEIEVHGPAGMGPTFGLFIRDEDANAQISAHFRVARTGDDERMELVDYTRKVREFPDGSIGDINGLSYGTVPVPPAAELAEHMRANCYYIN